MSAFYLDRPLQSETFRVIDTEGTDQNPERAKVCEVAWIDVTFNGDELSRFQSLINPGVPIPPGSSAVHHLVDEDVSDAPRIEEIVATAASANVFVAHGASYDAGILGLYAGLFICTHRLAKHLWPTIRNHSNQEIRYTLKLKPRLDKDAPAHRALNDAAVTASILAAALPLALEKWPTIQTVGDLIQKINAPALLYRVPFASSDFVPFEDAEISLLQWIVRKQAGGEDCIFSAEHWLDRHFNPDRHAEAPIAPAIDMNQLDIPF